MSTQHWKLVKCQILVPWKRAPRQLMTGIEHGHIRLQPFFLPLCSPASASSTVSPDISFRPFADNLLVDMDLHNPAARCSSKTFREACQSSHTPPSQLTAIDASHWFYFWSLSLTTLQRNVLYRYINASIPYQSLLHRIFPLHNLSPLRIVCSDTVDSIDHFCSTATPRLDQKPQAPSHLIVMVTLANIWSAHYQLVFNQQPFLPSTILSAIRLDVQQTIDENHVHGSL
ncbi:hypothetical protein [Parasitella parasitica]|uniref:Uncharacterized protein n=1 Tax=Parasitella parasitica TaxID=35722 RepID=A0A0B7NE61_9FUNG|nr:hypothetical protein [Parasitella parasitica]